MRFLLSPIGIAIVIVLLGAAWMTFARRRGGGKVAPARERVKKKLQVELGGDPALLRVLDALPAGFVVQRALDTPEGVVPAVVLGPTGLWVVASTTLSGTIAVVDGAVVTGGRETDLASVLWRRGHGLAERMAVELGGEVPAVGAVLVFTEAGTRLTKREAMGVVLITPAEALPTIAGGRVRLDPATLADMSDALARVAAGRA